MKLTTHSDGGARQKGVIAGAGSVVYDEQGNELEARAKFLQNVTVPQAEYIGLIMALQVAHRLGGAHITALVDAELIARHLSGAYQVRSAKLKPLYELAKLWVERFEVCEVREFPKAGPKHKRRHGNERADELANMAMDQQDDFALSSPVPVPDLVTG